METKIVKIGNVAIGGKEIVVIAGPCAVESNQQLLATAHAVKKSGAKILRGSAFKPRSSPDAFQGLGKTALSLLKKARRETGMPVVSEIMDSSQIFDLREIVDCFQVGTRSAQNFELFKQLGNEKKPILVKNGMGNTVKEFLASTEYILKGGNNALLCLRGIRSFETETRFSLDLGLIPAIRMLSDLPIVVDPSHPAGRKELVPALAKAAVAAGADALLIEVHPHPEKALSDSKQQLNFKEFSELMLDLKKIALAVGRKI